MAARTWAVLLLTALLVVAVAETAEACSCRESGPACQAFWKMDAVFDGTVEHIEVVSRSDADPDGRPFQIREHGVHLKVREAWKGGVQPGPLEIRTNAEGASCGYEFKQGERYLIFATKRPLDGRWSVSLCSATHPYAGTGDSAGFLASLAAPPRGGRVFGAVTLYERVLNGASVRRGMPARLLLFGGGQNRTTTTAADGGFEFTGLAPGYYQLELQPPDGYTALMGGRAVHVPNGHGCARENYSLLPDTRIAGRLVGHDGRPVSRQTVEATHARTRPHPDYGFSPSTAYTDTDGYFEFRGLPPGEYIVGVNLNDRPTSTRPYARSVYPSDGADGQVLPLALGQTIDVGIWKLPPPLAAVRLSALVTWEDGTPAGGVYVHAWDRTNNATGFARGVTGADTGGDGRVVLNLLAGRVYTFTVDDKRQPVAVVTSPRIETAAVPEPIRIVIRRTGKTVSDR